MSHLILMKGRKWEKEQRFSISAIMGTAKIGNCSFGQNVFVGHQVIVGNGCKIQNNVSLYEGVILEDYVF